jgi:hypothetical protein
LENQDLLYQEKIEISAQAARRFAHTVQIKHALNSLRFDNPFKQILDSISRKIVNRLKLKTES